MWVTVALVVLAVASVVVWSLTDAADAWMPSVATTLLSVAATITVVGWIVRREERERRRPWQDRALYWLGFDLRMFMDALLLDYAETHLHTYRPIPSDVLEMIGQWQADHSSEDAAREDMDHRGRRAPLIVLEAIELAQRLKHSRGQDLAVLEPSLIREIDDFIWAAGQADQLCAFGFASGMDAVQAHRTAAHLIVHHFQLLANVFPQFGASPWREIPELSRRANAGHHRHRVAAAEASSHHGVADEPPESSPV